VELNINPSLVCSIQKRLRAPLDGRRVELANLGSKLTDLQASLLDASPTLAQLEAQRRDVMELLEAQHTALGAVLRERDDVDRSQVAVHPLLKVSAHRDVRDAFLPRPPGAPVSSVPGLDLDEPGTDLQRSLALARARAAPSTTGGGGGTPKRANRRA
jgi:hypothetical protein